MFDVTRAMVAWLSAAVIAAPALVAQTRPPAPTAPAPAPAPAPSRADGQARHLIWRVSKDGRTVAYLVGAIHVLTKDSYPLPAAFDAAYKQSSVLVEELDLGAAPDGTDVAAMAAAAVLPEGQTLATLLDPPTYARVSAKAAGAGLPMLLLDRMKPWLVAVTLTVPDLQRAGFDPAHGLDRHFYERAKTDAKPVRGLETMAYQLDRLNGLSMPVQIEMLRAMLDDVDTQLKSVEDIIAGWRAGDVAALERLLLKEFREAPEVYQRLLVERNRNWAPAIGECQAAAPCFVVVGGAHLLGPDSVVALLQSAGFVVEQQ
jgi:uncharacterized protein YbaP (TraB family)